MIHIYKTTRRAHDIPRVVHRAVCDSCGTKWPEAPGEFEARRLSRGHRCGEAS